MNSEEFNQAFDYFLDLILDVSQPGPEYRDRLEELFGIPVEYYRDISEIPDFLRADSYIGHNSLEGKVEIQIRILREDFSCLEKSLLF